MRTLFIVFSSILTLLGILFTVLPLGTLAFLPIGLGILFAILALLKSQSEQKKLPRILLILLIANVLTVAAREFFAKDEVVVDQQFNQQKEASKKEAQKELEELNDLK